MFCTKCGAQVADNAKFCTGCGATLAPVEPVAPVAEPTPAPVAPVGPVAPAAETAPVEPKERTKIDVNAVKTQLGETLKPVTNFLKKIWANKPLSFGIIGGVAAILILCIVLAVVDATGYKSALNNMMDLMNGDAKKLEQVMPAEYWDYMDDKYGTDLDDAIDEYEDTYKASMKSLKSKYGKNIKYSYTIDEATKVDKDDLEEMAEEIAKQFSYVDEDDIKEAYEVDIELTIKGSKDDDSEDIDVLCVKIGSSWYAMSYYDYGETTYYSFVANSIF